MTFEEKILKIYQELSKLNNRKSDLKAILDRLNIPYTHDDLNEYREFFIKSTHFKTLDLPKLNLLLTLNQKGLDFLKEEQERQKEIIVIKEGIKFLEEKQKYRHKILLKTNLLYPKIWSELQFIEELVEPFITLEELIPRFDFFDMIKIEDRANHAKFKFYGQVITYLDTIEKIISKKLIKFHDDYFSLEYDDATKNYRKVLSLVNKYEPKLIGHNLEKTNFNGRILPIVKSISSRKGTVTSLDWKLTLEEFGTAIALETRKYYKNILKHYKSTFLDYQNKEKKELNNLKEEVISIFKSGEIDKCFSMLEENHIQSEELSLSQNEWNYQKSLKRTGQISIEYSTTDNRIRSTLLKIINELKEKK